MLNARSKCFFLGEGRRRAMMDLRSAALLSQPCVTVPIVTSCTSAVALTISWIIFIPPSSARQESCSSGHPGTVFAHSIRKELSMSVRAHAEVEIPSS